MSKEDRKWIEERFHEHKKWAEEKFDFQQTLFKSYADHQDPSPLTVEKLDRQTEDIKYIKERMDTMFVTQAEFNPVKKIVYGLIGLIVTGVFTSILSLVLQ